ncbi:GTP-binding protein [Oceanobacillus sp. CF4.6]|uniref:GTP-binding protein n=1 Tax=Oceanobacillus sp. CF4.6 TaxID=3373080 RepID=UPI003EE6C0F4
MTFEKQLINKTYYKTFIEGNESIHPIQVLGEMYMTEQKKEVTDLSSIRFSQGEVYFLNKDFESAIFKWENISDDLKPWAQKNIADAHYELDLLAIAEEYYKAVQTDSDVLKSELLLQLFSLYIERGKIEQAANSITNAIDFNPDYPNVTDLARAFFEEQQDIANAVRLAVKEAIRTESLSWYEVLETYVELGYTAKITPNYFREALITLNTIDQARFESLVAALWNSYKKNDLYFPWLNEINDLLLNIELGRSYIWQKLSVRYREDYFELINGDYLIRDLSHLIPKHLTNWVKLSTVTDGLISSTAVLAWNDIFPSTIDASIVTAAESIVSESSPHQNGMENGLRLFDAIQKWATNNGVLLSEQFGWWIREQTDLEHYHLLIAGTSGSAKADFVNTLVGEELEGDCTSAILFKDGDEAEMHAISDKEIRNISHLDEIHTNIEKTLILWKKPLSYLHKNKLTLIDTPVLSNQSESRSAAFPYLHVADSVLYVLNADSPLTGKELDMAVRMNEQQAEMSIHFIIGNMEQIDNNEEARELIESTTAKINTYFPYAKVFAFSKYYEHESQLDELSAFIGSMKDKDERDMEVRRAYTILYYIKESIKYLFDRRTEIENSLMGNIKWNEEMVTKLEGAVNQLSDMEEEKVRVIHRSYNKIKDEMREQLTGEIPKLLRECSKMVKEDSNFEKIHVQLNEEMNKQVFNYIEGTILPEFRVVIQRWIIESEEEFNESQTNLKELSESFNYLYGEEKMVLDCDFKVLDDWRRDADRMTRGNIQLANANILLRSTPSQLLFKSAGKIFGSLSQNKGMLQNKYKQFIEGKDYSETAESITDTFMQQFEIFEQSLARDMSMFFANPHEVLHDTLKDTHKEIKEDKDSLSNMRENPEIYRDPLTQFDLKLRQFEWMATAGEQIKV